MGSLKSWGRWVFMQVDSHIAHVSLISGKLLGFLFDKIPGRYHETSQSDLYKNSLALLSTYDL